MIPSAVTERGRARAWRRALAVVALVLASAASPEVSADGSNDDARAELATGVAFAEQNRWEEALVAFRRAHALSPQPATLLNVAGAEAQTGRLVAATESYRRLLRTPGLSDGLRGVARTALAAAELRVARLRISVDRRGPGDRVLLDGRALITAELGGDVPVDPGAHTLLLERDGVTRARSRVALREGETRAISLRAPAPAEAERSRSLFASPWFWATVGVVVTGGTIAAVCATGACSPESCEAPHCENLR
jgi:tetratricopeptide (TPR) repeat protein